LRRGQRWGLCVSSRAYVATALGVAILLGSACGIADKRDQAELLRAGATKLAAAKTAQVALTQRLVVIKAPEAGEAGSTTARKAGYATPRTTATVDLDYARRLMVAKLPPNAQTAPGEPVQFFREGAFYLRRLNAPSGTRAWLKFDFGPLYEDRKAKKNEAFGASLFNPAWIVDLTRGALTGSVKRLGAERVGEKSATHFEANFDWEKALKALPQRRRETIETALEMMGVPKRVVKGAIWVGSDGVPLRVEANIRQQRDRHRVVEWQYRLDFSEVGRPLSIELPLTRDISVVNTVASLGVAISTDTQQRPTP
jgi:hypothetical protein